MQLEVGARVEGGARASAHVTGCLGYGRWPQRWLWRCGFRPAALLLEPSSCGPALSALLGRVKLGLPGVAWP